MIRPHAGNGQRRALSVWKWAKTFFFSRPHWSCPWIVDYFTIQVVPELGYDGPPQVEFFQMASRPQLRSSSAGDLRAADPGSMLRDFPKLTSTLLDLLYDGTTDSRLPGTLMVRPSAGSWLLILKDPSSGLQLRAQAGTFEDALTSLELLLSEDACPWEPDPYASVKPRGKKK